MALSRAHRTVNWLKILVYWHYYNILHTICVNLVEVSIFVLYGDLVPKNDSNIIPNREYF
jgi:hypothetical protein